MSTSTPYYYSINQESITSLINVSIALHTERHYHHATSYDLLAGAFQLALFLWYYSEALVLQHPDMPHSMQRSRRPLATLDAVLHGP